MEHELCDGGTIHPEIGSAYRHRSRLAKSPIGILRLTLMCL